MKKIKYLISLALLAVAPTIYAQTKAAPEVPTFKVTLNVTNNGGGSDTLRAKKTTSDDKYETLLFHSTPQKPSTLDQKVTYNTDAKIIMVAEAQKMLESFTVNNTDKLSVANGAFQTTGTDKGRNTYSFALGELKEKTDIVLKWVDKPEVKVTISGTEQTVSQDGAKAVTVTTNIADLTLTPTYYSDKACTSSATLAQINKAGTYYIKLQTNETVEHKGVDMVVPLVINEKITLSVATNPTVSTGALQGQPLSTVTFTGGKVTVDGKADHVIAGTWSWDNPNLALKGGTNNYAATFTPDSSAIYNAVKVSAISVAAKKVATVTVKQTVGGTVTIDKATADNKYVGTTDAFANITATATPDAGYKFVKWVTPSDATSADSELAVTKEFSTVEDGTVITAEFAKATRKVKLATMTDGTVEVRNGTTALSLNTTGIDIEVGTTLTLTAKPNESKEVVKCGYTYKKENANGTDPETDATSFVVGGEKEGSYTIAATFKEIVPDQYMISVSSMENGTVVMKQGNDIVTPNSSVVKGSTVNIIAVPNKGYRLKELRAGGTDITKTGLATVNDDMAVVATFEPEEYLVSTDGLGLADITVSGVASSGSKYAYKSKLQVSAREKNTDNYKIISLLVNNKPVANGSEIIVEGPTTITVDIRQLVDLKILNPEVTTVTYNSNIQEYAVETANNLGNFNIKYRASGNSNYTDPIAANTYTVVITRPADAVYKAVNATRTLIIEKALPGILDIPAAEEINNQATGKEVANTTTVKGVWRKGGVTERKSLLLTKTSGEVTFETITFYPEDPNISPVTVKAPQTTEMKNKAETKTITINGSENGVVGLKNQDADVTSGQKLMVGLKLTVTLKANPGYRIDWSKVKVNDQALSTDHTFTIEGNDMTIDASSAFVEKMKVKLSSTKNVTMNYTSMPVNVIASQLDNLPSTVVADEWIFTYKQGDNQAAPVNAASYDIYASCKESETHTAATATKVGTLKIEQAKLTTDDKTTIVLPTASGVLTGAALSTSTLTGGSVSLNGQPVAGSFKWANESTMVNAAGEQTVSFTTTNPNYDASKLNNLQVYVSLLDVQTYTVTIQKEGNANGEVQITNASGVEVKSGDLIQQGMQLTITPVKGEIESVTGLSTSENKDANGKVLFWTCTAPANDFTLTITFKSGTVDPGKPEEPGDKETAVTGITLDKTTLELQTGKTYRLIPTITPTDATNKSVKWISTDPKVATVTSDGTVKAIKGGNATIIATTEDGGYTALCEVTVNSTATGIEEILSESRIYGLRGAIRIEPTTTMNAMIIRMNGQIVYNDTISASEQIPAGSGIYIVRLSASGKTTTTKVIVK